MLGKKTGGRKKGTPNKENPLKGYLKAHSLCYFEPKEQIDDNGSPRKISLRDRDNVVISEITLADSEGNPLMMSDFEVDMMLLMPQDRVSAELRLLKFHTPEMKAVDIDVTSTDTVITIENRLAQLSGDSDDE